MIELETCSEVYTRKKVTIIIIAQISASVLHKLLIIIIHAVALSFKENTLLRKQDLNCCITLLHEFNVRPDPQVLHC